MGIKRLLLELLAALLLARFAMVIGNAYAEEPRCPQGLPALAAAASILEHDADGGCFAQPGQNIGSVRRGSDGQQR